MSIHRPSLTAPVPSDSGYHWYTMSIQRPGLTAPVPSDSSYHQYTMSIHRPGLTAPVPSDSGYHRYTMSIQRVLVYSSSTLRLWLALSPVYNVHTSSWFTAPVPSDSGYHRYTMSIHRPGLQLQYLQTLVITGIQCPYSVLVYSSSTFRLWLSPVYNVHTASWFTAPVPSDSGYHRYTMSIQRPGLTAPVPSDSGYHRYTMSIQRPGLQLQYPQTLVITGIQCPYSVSWFTAPVPSDSGYHRYTMSIQRPGLQLQYLQTLVITGIQCPYSVLVYSSSTFRLWLSPVYNVHTSCPAGRSE